MLNDTLPSVFNSIALEKQASKKVIWALLRLYGSKARKAGALISGNMSKGLTYAKPHLSKGYDFAKTELGNLKTLAENSRALRYTTYGGMAGGGLYGSHKLSDSIFGTQNLDQEGNSNESESESSDNSETVDTTTNDSAASNAPSNSNVNTSTNDKSGAEDGNILVRSLNNISSFIKQHPGAALTALGIGGLGTGLYLYNKDKKKNKKKNSKNVSKTYYDTYQYE